MRKKPDGAEIRIVSKGDVEVDKVRSDIQRRLEEIGVKNAAVSVEILDGLERTSVAKTKKYFPLPRKKSN